MCSYILQQSQLSESTAKTETLTAQVSELETNVQTQESEKSNLSGELKDLKLQVASVCIFFCFSVIRNSSCVLSTLFKWDTHETLTSFVSADQQYCQHPQTTTAFAIMYQQKF